MSATEDLAKEIASNIEDGENNYSFDFGLIIIIGSIIIGVLQLLMKCNVFGRSLEDRVKNPGPLDKILLRKAVKDKLPKEYAHLRPQVQDLILAESKKNNIGKFSINRSGGKKCKLRFKHCYNLVGSGSRWLVF
jgi:hypothetical protein